MGIPVATDWEDVSKLPSDVAQLGIVVANRGFIMFANEKYDIAKQYFIKWQELEPLSANAVNNQALCHLYDGDVGKGAKLIEYFINDNPRIGAQHAQLMTNLRSLYDLTDSANLRKKAILKVIIPELGDDFDSSFIKL